MSDPEKAEVLTAIKTEGDAVEDVEDEEESNLFKQGAEDEGLLLMEELPPEVHRRIKFLKKNQLEITKIEAQFYKEMHDLECKYLPLYQPHFEKRATVVTGKYEPTDAECDLSEMGIPEDMELNESLEKMAIDGKKEKLVGIPGFWTQIFRNVELLSDLVQEYDFPILKHLEDIKIEMMAEPMGFKLHFHFTPNEYFTNSVLTKTYFMKSDLDKEEPFSFEGPEIVNCVGCSVDWVKGKNVTVKTVRKKQKHKQRGSIRTVTKTVEVPSFFNFFSPPVVPEGQEDELDEDTQIKLTSDFEVGQYIRERIVPRAVLYYTGEALEEEESDDEYDEEEEEGEEEEDEDDEGQAKAKKPRGKRGDPQGKSPQECKQQ